VKKRSPLSAFLSMLLLFMLLVTIYSAVPVQASLSWSVQTVDNNAYTFQSRCPIALDSNNSPHIAYTDVRVESDGFQTPLVMYANWNGTDWSTQQIAIGRAFSLVLDANDHPHVLYSRSREPLMYASLTGTSWVSQTVDANGAGFGMVALDSSGNPHVAYTDGTSIKYAILKGSSWDIQTVATYKPGDLAFGLAFALDKNNNPYIMYSPSSYADYSQPVGIQAINVTLATYQNSSWKIQPLSLPPPTGDYGNIVVDSKGYLHSFFMQHYVSSDNRIRGTILYASWNGIAWETQTVVSNISLPYSLSLALDSNDYPHISYSTGEPMYASWTGTAWDIQTADFAGYLAVDANGNPHISYVAGSPTVITNLMYATATETAPSPTAQPSSPTFPALPLLIASATVIIGAIIITVYFKKRKH
jgi:hypothetical protein